MFVPDPREGMDVNFRGFLNVLHYSSKNGVERVVYAMSSSMYGNAPVPWKEEDLSIEACPNAYAYSLLARSFFGRFYSEHQSIKTLGLIYFSVYGPYEKAKGPYANIISQFLWAMAKGESPVLYGDGLQSRDFVHVDDVVEANFLAMQTAASGKLINIGSGKETSMKRIVELLNQYLGTSLKPNYAPNPIIGYCYRTLADTRQAHSLLSFLSRLSLEDGLRSLVRFYGY
jgi:UDP-glucose 4-epimerase